MKPRPGTHTPRVQKYKRKTVFSSAIAHARGGHVSSSFIQEDGGFSTSGMVIALLLSLALIFTTAQVYQVNSAAATIQNVADVAVLAAENQVAEFMIIVQISDAIVLSLSLMSIVLTGLGLVALCVPAIDTLADSLLKAGKKLFEARNSFAEKAADGLNTLQKLLPFISAAQAESLAKANSGGPLNAEYTGLALLLPFEGEEISVGPADEAKKFLEDVDDDKEAIKELADEAEKAAEKAREEKEKGFLYDCGNNPSYCMYERASHLSTLDASLNPFYHSLDTWDYSVALKRAQNYYPQRLSDEQATGTSVEAQADSILRKHFYAFAADELARGYVYEGIEEGFDAYFPLLPKNTSEMKETTLYTDAVYPIGIDSSGNVLMHAWAGCPSLDQSSGLGSVKDMDQGGFETCPQCKFSVSSFGKIASATSSIETGFEYHYRAVAESALAYQEAMEAYTPCAQELQDMTSSLFEQMKAALKEAASYRIKAAPPGNLGAIILMVNTASSPASTTFASRFVHDAGDLGMQVALSASTLVPESSSEGNTIISSFLDGLREGADGQGFDIADKVFDLWSYTLLAYGNGQQALSEGLEKVLDNIPFMSESGLGAWAAKSLKDLIETLGLEPAKLEPLKPVLINSAHVLQADESLFSQALLGVKKSYLSLEDGTSENIFGHVLSQVEARALEAIEDFDGKLILTSIELSGEEGASIPILISLPPAVTQAAKNLIEILVDSLRGLTPSFSQARRWQ